MRPQLEPLENRLLPSAIIDHGGPVLPHPAITNVFVGSPQPQMDALTGVLAMDYLPRLGVYGVGAGSFTGSAVIPSLGAAVSDYSPSGGLTPLQSTLVADIQAGILPAASANSIYIVYLVPGEAVQSPGGGISTDSFSGYHDYFTLAGKTITYAVIVQQSTTDDESYVVSHEVAEAATDPLLNAWATSAGLEIADIFSWQTWTLDGFQVALVAGADGQPLPGQVSPPPVPPPAPPTLPSPPQQPPFSLAQLEAIPIEEARLLLFGLLADFNPAFAPQRDMAAAELHANPMHDTLWGLVTESKVREAIFGG